MAAQPPSAFTNTCNISGTAWQISAKFIRSLQFCHKYVWDKLTFEFDPRWRRSRHLGFTKTLISPAWLDRFLPNLTDRRIEATDMFLMCFDL
jgi:hypothetical protein